MYNSDDLFSVISVLSSGSLPKWPQMIVTGKPVTVENAKDIIFRTDSFLTSSDEFSGGNNKEFNEWYREVSGLNLLTVEKKYPDSSRTYRIRDWEKIQQLRDHFGFIDTEYVHNSWGSCAFVFGAHGWCHPDGTIAYVDNVGKWPSIESLYSDWAKIAKEFPYLDLHVTFMSGESCEDDATPFINFEVKNGEVKIRPGNLAVHSEFSERAIDAFSIGSRNELGLPEEWYTEFAEKIKSYINQNNLILWSDYEDHC